ncbi:tRNA lysidine(34) synthetase TilS [Aureivirga sp. CE67]|uniref:tRNA lysidine(34) synthetase TilS n=1 Tax=Aureivirga sp. CE67 TaxID=1788983 RepID=UPI0018C9CC19|nr:tRNA lysidine(34) synthetase TilS [Aureivirga sp. CE67]
MTTRFQQHIQRKLPFLLDKKLLLATSGGIDSIVLLHLCHKLGFDIVVAHCNFNLRGEESDADEEFVRNLSNQLQIPIHTISFETEKYAKEKQLSIQMAARELRYDWFQSLIEKNNLDFILTAHHKDDVLETFLINFTRGTGLEGLTGIPEINGNIVRPLLPFTREEIESFAKENEIIWREDHSNASTKYFRNKIRHKVVPILKELNSNFMDSFQNTLEHLNNSNAIIQNEISQLKEELFVSQEDYIKIEIKKILELKNPKAYLYYLLQEYGFTSWTDIYELLTAQSGKQILSKTHRLIKDRDFLLLDSTKKTLSNENILISESDVSIDSPIRLTFTKFSDRKEMNSPQEIFVDKDLLNFPLTLRQWKEGDYFCPLGMRGKKKLSKFFKDEKFSILEKERTWVLCSENEIVWIIGKRIDRRFQPTKLTTNFLKIKLNK